MLFGNAGVYSWLTAWGKLLGGAWGTMWYQRLNLGLLHAKHVLQPIEIYLASRHSWSFVQVSVSLVHRSWNRNWEAYFRTPSDAGAEPMWLKPGASLYWSWVGLVCQRNWRPRSLAKPSRKSFKNYFFFTGLLTHCCHSYIALSLKTNSVLPLALMNNFYLHYKNKRENAKSQLKSMVGRIRSEVFI